MYVYLFMIPHFFLLNININLKIYNSRTANEAMPGLLLLRGTRGRMINFCGRN